jgi:hypothetical protein
MNEGIILKWILKQLECEADHPPAANAETENVWSYISTFLYIFMVGCLIKHRNTF